MIFISVIVLIIAIVILTIKYIRVHAKAVSREHFEAAAARHASEMEYESPVITCDYCGFKIDTRVHDKCPNCGASFACDKEWMRRFEPDMENVDRKADNFADSVLREAEQNAARTAKKLKRCIIALCIITSGLVILALIVTFAVPEHDFVTKDEKLNSGSYESYEPVNYEINDSGVIVDFGGFKVSVTGIYENQQSYSDEHDFKIGLHVENESGQAAAVAFSLAGVNGMAPEGGYDYFYDWYKDHADVDQYARIYNLEDPEVCEIIFTDIHITGDDYEFSTAIPDVVLTTSSKLQYSADLPEEKTIYNEHDVTIMCRRDEEGQYLLWIANDSDVNYSVKTSNMKINGVSADCSGLYNQLIPAHYICPTRAIYTYDKSLLASTGALIELSLEFFCETDPALNFATGYLKLDPQE